MTLSKRAIAKYIHVSPFKVRRVAKLIRRSNVINALNLLSSLPQKGAKVLSSVLHSAAANATQAGVSSFNDLTITEVLVNEAPSFKRYKPRARGRINQITKRSSHVSITVSQVSKRGDL